MKHCTILAATLLLAGILSPPALAGDGALDEVMKPYEEIREALVSDSLDGVPRAAATLRERVEELRDASGETIPGDEDLKAIVAAAQKLEKAGDLDAGRNAFYELSKPLVRWRQDAGQGPDVAFCPMKKRSWLQPSDQEITNPYYGQEMARCGEIVSG
ncbi:MAG: DUF3347 domain-containing protein [Thermoanaerobaculia bacterium]|nr:DUF3347 domain-containing protein [Thermoanaerobaculia bacterium]